MEQFFKNIGAGAGLMALIIVWLGVALWLRVEADKRNMIGWAWAFAGILLPVLSLFVFLIVRARFPIAEEVAERDIIMEEAARQKAPFFVIKEQQQALLHADDKVATAKASIQAALEAEQRRFQERE